MAGSIYGKLFTISTWGESHGKALGVVVDGCPAGIPLCEEDIQIYLNRRKPGQNQYSTQRNESDTVEILSGVFEGKTTGTPISMLVRNQDQHSKDYGDIAVSYRPGHADYCFDEKFGFRDYRGGGRSSGRETIGRVAAGAIAAKVLKTMGIELTAYTSSIGEYSIDYKNFDKDEILENPLYMPDKACSQAAGKYLTEIIKDLDSIGSSVECIITGMPVGVGEPVFSKLDALLAQGIMSIGAVKAVEIGDGTLASKSKGSVNNDEFTVIDGLVTKTTNHAGGILGGMSDGTPIKVKASFKPTPSIYKEQHTINNQHKEITMSIKGRHDPIIGPRAVVVVEAMCAITILDLLMINATSKIDNLLKIYNK
ncbi:MAG: chorismate synthase [Lachnospiraceae bacterium]|nr:chorismate synthase [Lachnospiraceae bacterium]